MNFFRWSTYGMPYGYSTAKLLPPRGYSTAELLTVLLIVGSVSTYTIPKVLGATTDTRRNAVIKETVAAFSEAVHIGRLSGSISVSNYGDYMLSHINALKICPNNAYTEGCWDQASQNNIPSEAGQPGIVMHNGATLMGIDNGCCEVAIEEWCNGMVLDWNGPKAPNLMGDDQILIEVNYGNKDGVTGWCDDNRRGTVNIEVSQAGGIWGKN